MTAVSGRGVRWRLSSAPYLLRPRRPPSPSPPPPPTLAVRGLCLRGGVWSGPADVGIGFGRHSRAAGGSRAIGFEALPSLGAPQSARLVYRRVLWRSVGSPGTHVCMRVCVIRTNNCPTLACPAPVPCPRLPPSLSEVPDPADPCRP